MSNETWSGSGPADPREAARLTELLDNYQRRTKELTALYETAVDLSSVRDVDLVLQAIVRRGRQLLATDIAYLMLIDEARGDTFMRASEGTVTAEFMSIRLALGEGLGGLVAATGTPQWTSDYTGDPRFAESLDAIIRAESLTSILGVPLTVGTRVTGVLFASDRHTRVFTQDEVALLSSLATHAAIALENAALFEETQQHLERLTAAHRRIAEQNRALERAADLHARLTNLVLGGAPLDSLAREVAAVLGGPVLVADPAGRSLTAEQLPAAVTARLQTTGPGTGGSFELPGDGTTCRAAPVVAGGDHLGFLVILGSPLDEADVRALEGAALVTALLLLDHRVSEEAHIRRSGELLAELLAEPVRDVTEFRDRASRAGVPLPEPPLTLAVALTNDTGPAAHAAYREALRIAGDSAGLVRAQGARITLLVAAAQPAESAALIAERLTAAAGQPVTVGAVGGLRTMAAVAGAEPQALRCAKALEVLGRVGHSATPEQLGLYTLFFSDVSREQIDVFLTSTIGALLAHDDARATKLLDTVNAYFTHGGQASKVAAELFIHPNTLYQRLERIDRLLGAGWRDGDRGLQVHLAVRLKRLMDLEEGVRP